MHSFWHHDDMYVIVCVYICMYMFFLLCFTNFYFLKFLFLYYVMSCCLTAVRKPCHIGIFKINHNFKNKNLCNMAVCSSLLQAMQTDGVLGRAGGHHRGGRRRRRLGGHVPQLRSERHLSVRVVQRLVLAPLSHCRMFEVELDSSAFFLWACTICNLYHIYFV